MAAAQISMVPRPAAACSTSPPFTPSPATAVARAKMIEYRLRPAFAPAGMTWSSCGRVLAAPIAMPDGSAAAVIRAPNPKELP
ncbi:hypothetical protein [Streptomyces murinus]|uniref:hypothetical protein n=1 Tax=Streptomyces murinus TaxID=33900 RepID=UPI003825F8BB